MIRECPPFTGLESLEINFDGAGEVEVTTDPPWSQLMRPFPAALYKVAYVDLSRKVANERGLAWVQEIAETCKDALIVVLSHNGFSRAGTGFNWVADANADAAIDPSLNPPVVHPVPG
ncbi:hypothetical protein EXIGLDRAFT_699692 [Exidia glandulosa HHB12029]|uniref:Uncharacterized protein n=1 Tax=Exidia glandulosa HHB12029 TaxID=1314781 RepID=A0A165DSM2_EXIGL|nr:hypothetical protein EXIGLDRAFT_699692 [Exidia glandulosa HHB12029]